MWGGRATSDAGDLHEYANREWNGLMADFYLPRWQKWLDALEDALATGTAAARPWTGSRSRSRGRGSARTIRCGRWATRTGRRARVRDVLARAPYQGTLTVTAEPPRCRPAGARA